MNLETIKGYREAVGNVTDDEIDWLIAEVERLRARLPGADAPWMLKELDDAKGEIKRLTKIVAILEDKGVMLEMAVAEAEDKIKELAQENNRLKGDDV